jgi:hypothetical protein
MKTYEGLNVGTFNIICNDKLYALDVSPQRESPPFLFGKKLYGPQSVWMLWREKISPVLPGN